MNAVEVSDDDVRSTAELLASFADNPQAADIGPDDASGVLADRILTIDPRLQIATRHIIHCSEAVIASLRQDSDASAPGWIRIGTHWCLEAVASRVAQRLDELAHTDRMTGLPNRAAFERDMDALAEANASEVVVIASIDVDGLKQVNDGAGGYAGGDSLLKSVATGIGGVRTPGDQAYRVGGDEFVFVSRVQDPENVTRTLTLTRTSRELEFSFGIASWMPTSEEWRAVKERADWRMKQSKRGRRRRRTGQTLRIRLAAERRRSATSMRGRQRLRAILRSRRGK